MGASELRDRDGAPSGSRSVRRNARAIVYTLCLAALVAGVVGLPWDVPNRSFELLRNVTAGPDEAGARYVPDCLDQVFQSIAPGSIVALTADDPYWYQRAVEVGYPRVRFGTVAPDVVITMTAAAPTAEGSAGTVWTCGAEYILVVPSG